MVRCVVSCFTGDPQYTSHTSHTCQHPNHTTCRMPLRPHENAPYGSVSSCDATTRTTSTLFFFLPPRSRGPLLERPLPTSSRSCRSLRCLAPLSARPENIAPGTTNQCAVSVPLHVSKRRRHNILIQPTKLPIENLFSCRSRHCNSTY